MAVLTHEDGTTIHEEVGHGFRYHAQHGEFVTLEYGLAMGSIVAAVFCLIQAIGAAFTLWNDGTVSLGQPLGWMTAIGGGYVGAIWVALAALATSLTAIFFWRRSQQAFESRADYPGRVAYKVITYTGLALVALQFFLATISLFSIIITSLLLIGSQSSIGSLYVKEFLPTLVTLILTGLVTYALYRFAKGHYALRSLSRGLLALAGLVALLLIVTVAIRSHDAYSSNDYGRVEAPARQQTPGYYPY